MKKIALIIALSSTLFSFAKGIKISGELTNSENLKYIYLYESLGTEAQKIDSSAIKKGLFSFKGTFGRGYYRIGFTPKNNFFIILGDENPTIIADAKNLAKTAKINNSKENELLISFNKFNQNYTLELNNLQANVNTARTMQSTNPSSAEKMFKTIQHQYDSIVKVRTAFYNNLSTENDNSYIAKIAKFYLKVEKMQRNDFYNTTDINDPELQRGDMYVALTSTYMQKFLASPQSDYLSEATKIANTQKGNSVARELILISFIRNLMAVNPQMSARLGQIYKKEYPNSNYQKGLSKGLPALPVGIGVEAPEIIEKNPAGETVKLSSTRGKIVLLDFWASWCGPCRRENPNVVKAYNDYKDKGFTVFSVSLDKTKSKWEAAIKRDGLAWSTHVSDLKGWSSAPAKKYNVRGIPATFLLDKNGVIIAKNLRGVALEQKLEELLK